MTLVILYFFLKKEIIHRLRTIQDNQLQCWKELLMLEQRILSKFLPKNFDQLQDFITADLYSPIIDDDSSSVKYQLKHLKILQELKRIWLDIYLRASMLKIEQYDRHYQHELIQLQQCLSNQTGINLFQSVQMYLTCRNHRLKQEIYLQMTYFHTKLTHRRQRSSVEEKMIGVSPEVLLDVHYRHHDFNAMECEFLSRGKIRLLFRVVDSFKKTFLELSLGGSYIRPNRTSLRPYSERKKLVQEEHDRIMKKTIEYLTKTCPSLPSTSPLFKRFSQRLHACLTVRYMTLLPYMDQIRAKQERQMIKSIRRKLKKKKLILRESDKSGNLYIGQKDVFEQKAIEYRQQTGAYEELVSNPLEDTLIKVTRLLNDLHMKTKELSPKQYKKMIPTRKEVKLAYMYFNPKTHKVSTNHQTFDGFRSFILIFSIPFNN